MEFSSLISSLQLIKPEITISAFILLIVITDLVIRKDKSILPMIAFIGILIAGYFVIEQFSLRGIGFTNTGSAGHGMITLDSFAILFKIIVLVSSIFIISFSNSSIEIKKCQDRLGEYYTLIFGMILGMMLMVTASDLILIYLSLELMSLSSYVLSGFTKLRERSSEASLKYLIYGGVSSGVMLFGISLIYGMSGSTNLASINEFIRTADFNVLTLSFASLLVLAGIGFKISAAPFHFWTPDVYEGSPIAITAYLSIASKAAGFALLIRFVKTTFYSFTDINGNWHLLEVFDWQNIIIVIAIFTMTLGNFTALWQNNMKRMLAYSSIAHAGYMLLGLAVLSDQGLIAILIYLIFYMFMNLGAFYVVMLIANKTGSEELSDYDNLGSSATLLSVSLALFMIALAGIPPTAGFIGKLYIFIALVDAKMITVAIIALLNTVVAVYYYVRVLKHLFLTKKENPVEIKVPFNQGIVISLLLIPIFLFGIYFTPIVNLAKSCITLLGLQ